MKTKKTKITVETERLLVFARGRHQVESWCELCCAEVKMVGVEDAATVAGLSQRAIFRFLENGRLHFAETSSGALLICLNSLLKQVRAGE